jgi:hypothetical protein
MKLSQSADLGVKDIQEMIYLPHNRSAWVHVVVSEGYISPISNSELS